MQRRGKMVEEIMTPIQVPSIQRRVKMFDVFNRLVIPKPTVSVDFLVALKSMLELKFSKWYASGGVLTSTISIVSVSGMNTSKLLFGYSFWRNTYSLCKANRRFLKSGL